MDPLRDQGFPMDPLRDLGFLMTSLKDHGFLAWILYGFFERSRISQEFSLRIKDFLPGFLMEPLKDQGFLLDPLQRLKFTYRSFKRITS